MTAELSNLIEATKKTLLADPATEEKEQASDRLAASTTVNAGSIVQAAVSPGAPLQPDMSSLDTFSSMAYSKHSAALNPSKMVKLDHVEWSNTNGHFTQVGNPIQLPQVFWSSNKLPAWGQTRYFKFVRASMHFQIQVNAQMGAVGALLVVYAPYDLESVISTNGFVFGTLFNLPHVILNVATMTQADLFIPYVNSSNYAEVRSSQMGTLRFYVLAPFISPSGTPQTVDVTILGSFVDLDLQGPIFYTQNPPDWVKKTKNSIFKWVRNRIDIAEAPGLMNLSNCSCTAGAPSIALGGERAYYDRRTAGSKTRVPSFKTLVKIPTLLTTDNMPHNSDRCKFVWSHSNAAGANIYQANFSIRDLGNLGFISHGYQFWRGSIIFRLQIFSSNFHKGRLRFVISPCSTSGFDEQASNALIYQICDIGLDSTFDIVMPYTNANWMSSVHEVNFRLAVFVQTRLTYNQSCNNQIDCLLYAYGGDDFQFLVPSSDSTTWNQGWGSEMDLLQPLDESPDGVQESMMSQSVNYEKTDNAAVEIGLNSAENAGSQDAIVKSNDPSFLNFKKLRQDIYSIDHMSLDSFFGRAWLVHKDTLRANTTKWVSISPPTNGHAALMKCFCFWAGELNIHVVNNTNKALQVGHVYSDHATFKSGDLASKGCALIPPGEMASLCVPYYAPTPLRPIKPNCFGNVFLSGEANGEYYLYASLRAPNFMFPRPVPTRASARQLLQTGAPFSTRQSVARAITSLANEEDLFDDEEPQCPHFDGAIERVLEAIEDGATNFDLLALAGDIESNPGPAQLVYKDRGVYKHYGVKIAGEVFQMNTENLMASIFDGSAKMITTPDDGSWQVEESVDLDFFIKENLDELASTNFKFSIDENCETLARQFFPGGRMSQGTALKVFAMVLVLASSSVCLFGSVSNADMKLLHNQDPEDPSEPIVTRAMNWFSQTFLETFESDVVKFLCFGVIRLVCYLIMYCHAPNLLTTLSLGTLIFMDIKATRMISADSESLLKSLVEGDIKGLVTGIAERLQTVGETHEEAVDLRRATIEQTSFINQSYKNENPFDDFNKASLAAKNFEWWVNLFKKIVDWLKSIFKPSTGQQFNNWMEKNSDLLCDLLTTVNNHLKECRDPEKLRSPEFHTKHKWLYKKISDLSVACKRYAITSPFVLQIDKMQAALSSVVLLQPVVTRADRLEPVGVAIMGEPGQGKSFIVNGLIKRICKEKSWDISKELFPHPIGSQYYDGYRGQKIHLIDDMGQHQEEQDIALLCQAISSVPFLVPMAALEEKGIPYTSHVVFATTNKADFRTRTLNDSGALERRFGWKIKVRAKQAYTKEQKLNVGSSTVMEMIKEGTAWEYSEDGGFTWKPLELDSLARQIANDITERERSHQIWSSFMNEGPVESISDIFSDMDVEVWGQEFMADLLDKAELVFDWAMPEGKHKNWLDRTTDSIKSWFKKVCKNVKEWAERNKSWILLFSCIASALGILTSIYYLVKKDKPNKEEKIYSGQPVKKAPKQRFVLGKDAVTYNQNPVFGEVAHLHERCGYLSAKNTSTVYHVMAWKENKVLTYGHVLTTLECLEEPMLNFKGRQFPVKRANCQLVTLNGKPMDLAVITLDAFPIQFKDSTKYFTKRMGRENYLLWSSPQGMLMMPLKNAHFSGYNCTYEGTECDKTISYEVTTNKGMCGGLVLTRVDGAFRVAGMHIAGNGSIGKAVQLGFLNQTQNEGVVISKQPSDKFVHQSTVSKITKSPLYGVWPVEVQPAALSQNDKRLANPPQSLVKFCSEKYRVDKFQPDKECFQNAFNALGKAMQIHLGSSPKMTLEEACLEPSEHALDLSTSPGMKYTAQGLRKNMLVDREKSFIHPILRRDVEQMFKNIATSEVYFYSHLKDELRPVEKIMAGKTRCIEASDFDYTVVHRMVFGRLYERIYNLHPLTLGLAVGMDPWVDWDSMVDGLFPYNYDFDFSRFDGSLSRQLMEFGAQLLCLCIEDGDFGYQLLMKTIVSKHIVLDEEWLVNGGMPSGSPCTTVLNSVCNLLVSATLALQCTPGRFQLLVYGDDLIVSCEELMDCGKFQELAKEQFGMEVTPSSKGGDFEMRKPEEVSFLKRRTAYMPYSTYKVGALDLNNIKQHLMWCKNRAEFQTQLEAGLREVALHGKDVYESFVTEIKEPLGKFGIYCPNYEFMIFECEKIIFS